MNNTELAMADASHLTVLTLQISVPSCSYIVSALTFTQYIVKPILGNNFLFLLTKQYFFSFQYLKFSF